MSPKFSLIRLAGSLLAMAVFAAPQKAAAQIETAPQAEVSNEAQPIMYHWFHSATTASFTLASDAVIRLGTNSAASLPDLRVGQVAHVSYTIENGLWLAHEVVVNAPHSGHAGKSSQNSTTNMLHAHGAITAYNANTGNLTIKYHRGN